MTELITVHNQAYHILALKQYLRTVAQEEKGLETLEGVEACLDFLEKDFLSARRQEIIQDLGCARWKTRRVLKHKLETFPDEETAKHAADFKQNNRNYLMREVSRYRLERTSKTLPLTSLRLVAVEPLSPRAISRTNDGFCSHELQKLVDEAIRIAEARDIPYVALSENASEIWVPRNKYVSDSYDIILASLYVTNSERRDGGN